jgi:N-acetylglucosaminyl-diphospho-decaprenol L-rhamnosyltransferase
MANDSFDICVVVVNYRTPELVRECIRSLAREKSEVKFRVVVVDSGSGDGSLEAIRQQIALDGLHGWVEVLAVSDNRGFGAGINIALKAVCADAYLLLNSDTVVLPGAIRELQETLHAHPEIGLVGARLCSPTGEPQVSAFRWPRPASELVRAAASGPVTRALRSYDVPIELAEDPSQIEWLSFAAVMVRRDVIEDIGILDEGFFMYFEDTDYCRRARMADWGLMLAPRAEVIHLHGMSSDVEARTRARLRRPAYYYQSRARYFLKYYGMSGFCQANLYWCLGRLISFAREVVGRRQDSGACASEWRDNWSGASLRVKRQLWASGVRIEHKFQWKAQD